MNRLTTIALLAGALELAACAPNRTILDPPVGSASGLPSAGPVQLEALRDEAQSWVGAPYQLGGNTRSGVDCSGLVHNVFEVVSLELPRTVETLYEVGVPVDKSRLRLGDLVFFRFKGKHAPTHVGIYLGDGQFIHASLENGVKTSQLDEDAYAQHFVGSRRILG
jgi:cell wall-associated NlpC family hydrolase